MSSDWIVSCNSLFYLRHHIQQRGQVQINNAPFVSSFSMAREDTTLATPWFHQIVASFFFSLLWFSFFPAFQGGVEERPSRVAIFSGQVFFFCWNHETLLGAGTQMCSLPAGTSWSCGLSFPWQTLGGIPQCAKAPWKSTEDIDTMSTQWLETRHPSNMPTNFILNPVNGLNKQGQSWEIPVPIYHALSHWDVISHHIHSQSYSYKLRVFILFDGCRGIGNNF